METRGELQEARNRNESSLWVICNQAEGSAKSTSEGSETRDLTSATNKSPHECPAPHRASEGEEIVRHSLETRRAGLNSQHNRCGR